MENASSFSWERISYHKYFALHSNSSSFKISKGVYDLVSAFLCREKRKGLISKGYKDLSRGSVSNSSVLIYMNLFYRVIIASLTSTACLKPELNRSIENCINGAIVKMRKKTKYQNLLERLARKLNWKNQHAEASRLKTEML